MSGRLSLSNYIFKISHEQFLSLATAFKKASEQSFGTKATMEIGVYNAPKLYTTFIDDDIDAVLAVENEQRHVLTTQNIADINKSVWDSAGYVEAILKPVNTAIAPDHAFSSMEFLGDRPKQATFYIQGSPGNAAIASMKNQFKFMARGDGFPSNGSRSNYMPNSLPFLKGQNLSLFRHV